MRKTVTHIILFCLCLLSWTASAQTKINFRADMLDYDEAVLPGVERFTGNVVFNHGNTIGYCDSAYHYSDKNILEGFGENVRIHVNDSVTLYGKYLYYDGNTKIASISRNVVLMDNTSALYTDSLIYDLEQDVGYYITPGKMINKDNVLTSERGYFYTKLNEALLYDDVKLTSDSYNMDCQALKYNTQSEMVYFISRTHMVSDDNIIYTSSGWYNMATDIANLVKDVIIFNETQRLSGDTIYYDKNQRFGIGRGHVVIIDSAENYKATGNYIEHHETGGYSTITDRGQLILIDRRDSLHLHADTIKILFDSVRSPQFMNAYNHTKFYREDIQGACDSLTYNVVDSLLTMFYNPVIWSGENQLTADTIYFEILDSINILADLRRSGFIAASLFDEQDFNQIKGLNIIGHIQNRKLVEVDVIGNAECLYYIQEDDNSLMGVNSSTTSEMKILFENNEVQSIIFYNNPNGNIYPDEPLDAKERFLKDFRWLNTYRSLSPEDIFHTPIPREK